MLILLFWGANLKLPPATSILLLLEPKQTYFKNTHCHLQFIIPIVVEEQGSE
jgi:hypothetical protein